MKSAVLLVAMAAMAGTAAAKLPAPSDEAKAKAAENAARAAHGGKVEAYLLCQWQDKVAARYHADAKKAGTALPLPLATAPCVNPGPFVYTAPEAAGAAAPAPAPAAATAAAPAAKQ